MGAELAAYAPSLMPKLGELANGLELYPAETVIVMGQASATGLQQYLHRRLLTAYGPTSGRLPLGAEVRKDRPVPLLTGEERRRWGRFWSFYLDNFMEEELKHWNDLAVCEEPSEWQEAVRAAYGRHEVLRNQEKEVVKQQVVDRLGARLDGAFGAASTPPLFDLRLVGLTLWALRQERVPQKALQILPGRWVRNIQFRREASAGFKGLWRQLRVEARQTLSLDTREELLQALALLPFLLTDFRLVVIPLVTARDASESGFGIPRPSSLSARGQVALVELQGAAAPMATNKVGLVEVCGGIGGARRALELLGVEAASRAFVKCAPAARCVVAQEWPRSGQK